MAIVRDIEPWDALLDAGRADERLVREEHQHDRAPQMAPLPDELDPLRPELQAVRVRATAAAAVTNLMAEVFTGASVRVTEFERFKL